MEKEKSENQEPGEEVHIFDQCCNTEKNDFLFANILSGLTFITIGVVLLFNTLEIISWQIWPNMIWVIFKFWPVFLILIGIKIILGKNIILNNLSKFLGFALFFMLILTSVWVTNFDRNKDKLENNFNWKNFQIDKDLQDKEFIISENDYDKSDVETRDIDLKFATGDISIKDDQDSDDYLTLDANYYENFGKPNLESSLQNEVLKIKANQDSKGFFRQVFAKDISYNYVIGQTRIPSNIKNKITAGTADVEFQDLQIEKYELDVTAGEIDLDFSENSLPSEGFEIEITAGDCKLKLPEDVKIILDYDLTAGSFEVNNEKINKGKGERIFNENEKDEVIINVKITAGELEIGY